MKQPLSVFYCCLFWCFTSQGSFAQKRGNIWCFGYKSGLDFNRNPPAYFHHEMQQGEGCSSIADEKGNLLFYTDGSAVWNRKHQQMPHAPYNTLQGGWSATQSALIVPHPGDSNQYYIFTVDYQAGYSQDKPRCGCMAYAIVDMRADNGWGDLVTPSVELYQQTTEKLSAVAHRNGTDVWVVSHQWESNAFYAHLVTQSGLNTAAVISRVGPVHQFDSSSYYNFNTGAIGHMKLSPWGNKLALARTDADYFELYDFEDSTGRVSNYIRLSIPPSGYTNKVAPYGLEFSADGSKLYGRTEQLIVQFDLQDSRIASSAQIIHRFPYDAIHPYHTGGALQLGPDRKIYVSHYFLDSLSVIESPDSLGTACGYAVNSTYCGGLVFDGLPNLIQSYWLNPRSNSFSNIGSCQYDPVLFHVTRPQLLKSVAWDFGDPASGPLNYSHLLEAAHTYQLPGHYTVQLIREWKDGGVDTTARQVSIIEKPSVNLGPDTTLCPGQTLHLQLPAQHGIYRWQDDSFTTDKVISTPGVYWVQADNGTCRSRDSISVHYRSLPSFEILGDTLLCVDSDSLHVLSASSSVELHYQWSTGDSTDQIAVNQVGSYWVEGTDGFCTTRKSIQVVWQECPEEVYIPNVFTPNGDAQNETFEVRGILPNKWQLEMYNRFGKEVYTSAGYNNDWYAEGQSTGLYYYLLKDAHSGRTYKGWVQVLR